MCDWKSEIFVDQCFETIKLLKKLSNFWNLILNIMLFAMGSYNVIVWAFNLYVYAQKKQVIIFLPFSNNQT